MLGSMLAGSCIGRFGQGSLALVRGESAASINGTMEKKMIPRISLLQGRLFMGYSNCVPAFDMHTESSCKSSFRKR